MIILFNFTKLITPKLVLQNGQGLHILDEAREQDVKDVGINIGKPARSLEQEIVRAIGDYKETSAKDHLSLNFGNVLANNRHNNMIVQILSEGNKQTDQAMFHVIELK